MRLAKYPAAIMILAVAVSLTDCGSRESAPQREKDAHSPAGIAGKAAYSVAKESEKAAKIAGKKLAEAAHQAHEGWKEAAAKDKGK